MVAIQMGSDIGLPESEAPGVTGTYQLQLNVKGRNTSPQSVGLTLYIVVISEGIFTILGNTAVAQVGVVTKSQILSSGNAPRASYHSRRSLYGGDFFSTLKNFGTNAWNNVIKPMGQQMIKQGIPIVGDIARNHLGLPGRDVLPLPFGLGGDDGGADMSDEDDYGSGGQLMSRQELAKRAKRRH
jgi:hypothetical protein